MTTAIQPHIYTAEENHTWKRLYEIQEFSRKEQIHPIFDCGIKLLSLPEDRVPDLNLVNKKLHSLTGFRGVWVEGHEDPRSFFVMLKNREFPIGNFIRDAEDLGYTPAPDVFHDLYGHLPFLADQEYANFMQNFGAVASRYIEYPEIRRQFERLFWFTCEFSLIKTTKGRVVFGAGLTSSAKEINYALSDQPKVLPFDIEKIRTLEFKIDEFQNNLFLIEDLNDLYQCLTPFEKGI